MSAIGDRIKAHVEAQMAELERNPPPKPPRSLCRLSHWFPAVERVLSPSLYPATTMVEVEIDYAESMLEPDNDDWSVMEAAVNRVKAAVPSYPCFLRSDLVSGKHAYPKAAGIVNGPDDVGQTMFDIAECAAMAFMFGDQGVDVWAVRELLTPVNAIRSVKGLPIGSEWRLIVRDGDVTGESGFYWPVDALLKNAAYGKEDWAPADVEAYVADRVGAGYPEELIGYSIAVADELDGDWSVDWMYTTDGWKLIDMARAVESWIPNPKGWSR